MAEVTVKAESSVHEAVKQAASDGRMPCARALELARRLQVSPAEVGKAADELNIKIVRCQLGCFS